MILTWEEIYFTSDKFQRDVIRAPISRDDLLGIIPALPVTTHLHLIQPAIFLYPQITLQLLY